MLDLGAVHRPSQRSDVVVLVLAGALAVTSALPPLLGGLAPPALVVRSLSGALFIAAGGIAWYRGAPHRLGWLFVLAGCASCLVNLGLWNAPWAAVLRLATGGYSWFGAVLGHLLLTYPTGRARGGLNRLAIGCLYTVNAAYVAGQLLIGDEQGRRNCLPDGCPGVFAPPIASETAVQVQRWAHVVLSPAATALAVVAALRRWRAADLPERRLMRPVPLTVAAGVGLGLSTVLARALGWDAHDATRVIIAVVWGAGTSAIAAHLLLHVLRVRLVMYGMGELVRGLDPTTSLAHVQEVLRRVLRDPTAQVLVAGTDGHDFYDVDGSPVAAGTAHRTWHPIGTPPAGALVHNSASPPDLQVLDGVLRALALLVGNLRLQDQLQEQLQQVRASRSRLVDAADAERRRIERDLHDGAQQHLVVSALDVRLARERLRQNPVQAEELLEQAEEHLRAAVQEIRALARGLHPVLLHERGIGAAVKSLAERLPLQVAVEDATTRRYPLAIENAAYFVLAESLVNVVKHAGTAEAVVRLHEEGRTLLLEVLDRGRGLGPGPLGGDHGDPGAEEYGSRTTGGSGLPGLADRVATVGGTLQLSDVPGGGTRVHARLPVPAAPRRDAGLGAPEAPVDE
ncbi:sensor histidine kinase [Kineococcus sp. SYSU DK003]|uniref:sensor histidine kinase n=1 Tax=Kineococcus sp. SYSU DK003 TaxID=3383124 RepID=UPI003D7EC6F8